jgi:hypothetical protein
MEIILIRPLIREQLAKCQFADLNNFDVRTNTFLVRKYCKPTYDLNKCYLVKLPSNIVNAPDSVLAVNWNAGNFPKTAYLKIYVSKILGPMIFVDSVGFDFETKQDLPAMWSGWLDTTSLTQISYL